MRDEIKAAAESEGRSMTKEVVLAIEKHLQQRRESEEGFRWLPPDQQVPPQLLWGLEKIAKAEGVPLNLMLDAAVSYFIAEKEAELAEGAAQMEADETLSDLMERAKDAAADVPGASASMIDMKQRQAPKVRGSWVPRRPKGGKALSDVEMQELKEAVSATVAKELARLLGRE